MTGFESYVPITKLAEHLHVKISTVRNWVKCGYIPRSAYLKVGNTYRFNIPDTVKALRLRSDADADQEAIIPAAADPTDPVQLEFDFDSTKDL